MNICVWLIDKATLPHRFGVSAEMRKAEKEKAKADLSDILNYTEKLNELDTAGMPEMSHPFEAVNCFREDVVTNSDDHENLLANAPESKGQYIKVLKAVEQ